MAWLDAMTNGIAKGLSERSSSGGIAGPTDCRPECVFLASLFSGRSLFISRSR
jgi:hypothetical protein